MQIEKLNKLVCTALEDMKALDIKVLDVQGMTSVMDSMIIATGTSNRHVKSLADNLLEKSRAQGVKALGIEGQQEGDWVLVDLGDVVVHIMQPDVRAFYNLEKLWDREFTESIRIKRSEQG
jgi:ribosome-associated protein